MKWFFSLVVLLFSSYGFADLERWQKWEVERNDLQSNEKLYHKLPSKAELGLYQIERLYVLELSPEHVGVISQIKDLPEGLKTADGKIRFFIHPTALDLFKDLIGHGKLRKVSARPTSSPRTFFVENFMVKVSLSQKINGAIRTVYPLQMSRATSISEVLGQMPEHERKAAGFGFLPESAGLYDKTPNSPFGFVVREIPQEFVTSDRTLVPLLSYVAKDPKGSLLELDAKARGMSESQLIEKEVVPALLRTFAAAVRQGVVLEAHQQNTLLEVDKDGRFTGRIFYRDLDGARLDFELRNKLGLSNERYLKMQDAPWIFDLETLEKFRQETSVPANRPAEWSPVAEKAFQSYLIGSSVYILKSAIKGDTTNLDRIIEQEFKKMKTAPSCRAVF